MVRSGLASQFEEIFRYASSMQFTPKEGDYMLQQQAGCHLVRGSGMPTSERMKEPGCLAGAPKWTEKLGPGPCVVDADGRLNRISQPNLRYNSGTGESQVGLIHDRDGYDFARFWEEDRRLFFWNTRQCT